MKGILLWAFLVPLLLFSGCSSEPALKEAMIAEFEAKGFEYERDGAGVTGRGEEWWKRANNETLVVKESGDFEYARLTLTALGDRLTTKQITDMQGFASVAVPEWSESRTWVADTIPIALSASVDKAGFGVSQRQTFTRKDDKEIVGGKKEIRIAIQRERTIGGTPLITIRVEQYD